MKTQKINIPCDADSANLDGAMYELQCAIDLLFVVYEGLKTQEIAGEYINALRSLNFYFGEIMHALESVLYEDMEE